MKSAQRREIIRIAITNMWEPHLHYIKWKTKDGIHARFSLTLPCSMMALKSKVVLLGFSLFISCFPIFIFYFFFVKGDFVIRWQWRKVENTNLLTRNHFARSFRVKIRQDEMNIRIMNEKKISFFTKEKKNSVQYFSALTLGNLSGETVHDQIDIKKLN